MDYLGIVMDGFLLTLGFHIANLLIAIIVTLAIYVAVNVGIRLIAWIDSRRTAKQKQQRGVSDNND